MENIGTLVLATGALGTAAFGIVEALKWTRLIGLAGYGILPKLLGPIWKTLARAYGPEYETVLSGQYRGDHRELVRMIRQGVRVGLRSEDAPALANYLGVVDGNELAEAASQLYASGELKTESQHILGRFELAVDARIEAALAMAQSHYAGKMRAIASFIALAIGAGVGVYLNQIFLGLLVGLAAVPLAPIAKDLVSALQAATTALRRPV